MNTRQLGAGLALCMALSGCTDGRSVTGASTETGTGEDGGSEASTTEEDDGSAEVSTSGEESGPSEESSSSEESTGNEGGEGGDGDGDGDTATSGDGDGDTGPGLDCELLSQVEITDIEWSFTTPGGWQPTDNLHVLVTLSNPSNENIDYVGARILSDDPWLIDIQNSVNWVFVLGAGQETQLDLLVEISPFATEAQMLSLTARVVGIDENQCPELDTWDFEVDMSAP